jgi:hypothetical protein
MMRRAKREPRLDFLESCWQMKAPSGRVLECGIYKTPTGLEVRCQYAEDDLMRSQFAVEIGIARDIARSGTRQLLRRADSKICQ